MSVCVPVSVSAPVCVSVSVCVSLSMSPSVSVSLSASVFEPVSLFGDLGLEDPLMLSCFINEDILATCMIDSGASSQFLDLDFAINMNLPLVPKGKPEDLVLADGARSIIEQITHTCNLKLAIDQHVEELTFISKKNKHGFMGHRVSSWHRCLLVSLRCLSAVS